MRGKLDAEEQGILDEFLEHGRAVRAERARAAAAGEAPDFVPLVRPWGGVTLAYRKRLQDSPAYRLNHEEVQQGARGRHRLRREPRPGRGGPRRVRARRRRWCSRAHADGVESASSCRRAPCSSPPARRRTSSTRRSIPARSRSTQGRSSSRDSARCKDGDGRFALEPDANGFFTSYDARRPLRHVLRRQPPALRRQRRQGDGVGQARLSARRRAVRRRDRARSIRRRSRSASARWQALVARLDDELLARVERVVRLTPTIVEVIVRAPAAARHFHPGQFYRLQNSSGCSPHVAHRRSRRGAADGRHRADRRVGRSRTRAALADRAGDGRVEPAVRVPEAGRAGRGHGPDRDADRDPGERDGAARRRRPRQRRAVLDRQGAQGAAATGSSISPATRTARISSSARRSRRRPIR